MGDASLHDGGRFTSLFKFFRDALVNDPFNGFNDAARIERLAEGTSLDRNDNDLDWVPQAKLLRREIFVPVPVIALPLFPAVGFVHTLDVPVMFGQLDWLSKLDDVATRGIE